MYQSFWNRNTWIHRRIKSVLWYSATCILGNTLASKHTFIITIYIDYAWLYICMDIIILNKTVSYILIMDQNNPQTNNANS